jgi:hypothetical protein
VKIICLEGRENVQGRGGCHTSYNKPRHILGPAAEHRSNDVLPTAFTCSHEHDECLLKDSKGGLVRAHRQCLCTNSSATKP